MSTQNGKNHKNNVLSARVNKRKVKQECQNKDDKKVDENDVFCVFQHVAQLLNPKKSGSVPLCLFSTTPS